MSSTRFDLPSGQIASETEQAVLIRPVVGRDLKHIVAIEREAYAFPWSDGIFRDCLRVGYCCWLIELETVISGYGIMSVGAGESHVLNLCISPRAQNQGLGRRLLTHLLDVARDHRARTVMLEVRPTNLGALHLYRSMGFTEVGRRPGYYPGTPKREDALVLARRV